MDSSNNKLVGGEEPGVLFGLCGLPTFTPLLKRQKTLEEHCGLAPKCEWAVPNSTDYPSYNALKHLASEVETGLKWGFQPALADMSVGGAYFMRNRLGRIAAVFKPLDEEPYSPNNPREYRGSGLGMKNGIPAGEAGIREAAVFIIDNGFAGVQPTVMVKVQCRAFRNADNKEGSMQQYVRHIGTSDDYGPSKFDLEDAQRLMMLDIRICNQDRHAGNVLVTDDGGANGFNFGDSATLAIGELPMPPAPSLLRRSHSVGPSLELVRPQRARGPCSFMHRRMDLSGLRLIPIDHGFALPHPFAIDETELAWLFWPQAKQPLSKELKEWVSNLNTDEDIARVKAALGDSLPAHCFLTLRIGTSMLKLGVARGLSLYDIGMLIVRESPERPSRLESVIEEVRAALSAEGAGGSLTAEKDHARFMARMEPALETMLDLVRDRKMIHRSVSS